MCVLFMGQQVVAKQKIAYYLLAEEDGEETERYGIRIESEAGEREEILNLTISGAAIEELAALLMRNAVTPTTLRYVVEDWLLR